MLKFQIRKKVLKIRKKNSKDIRIKFEKIYHLLSKTKKLKDKIIGGYYPVNYEIDDLDILRKLHHLHSHHNSHLIMVWKKRSKLRKNYLL